MAIEDILLSPNSALEDTTRTSRSGRTVRESRGDIMAPTALSTDPGPPAAGIEEIQTRSLEDELAEAEAIPADSVSSAAQLDGVASTEVEGGIITAGTTVPAISAGSPSSDEVATTNKATGNTITAGTGTPDGPVEQVSVEEIQQDPQRTPAAPAGSPGQTLEDTVANVETEDASLGQGQLRTAQQQTGGGGLTSILARPAVQKALTQFGRAAAGGDNEAVNAIASFGRRQAESNAQAKLRENLEAGQSVEDALQDPQVQGISAQGRQQVVSRFQQQELAEDEQELAERQAEAEIRQGERRLDQQEQQLQLQRKIQQGELEIAEDREERLRQGQAFDEFVQRRQLALEGRAQEMEELMNESMRSLRDQREKLLQAEIEDLRSEDGEFGDLAEQINALNRVAGTAAQLEQQTAKQIRMGRTLKNDIVEDLPESNELFGGTRVRNNAKGLVQQVESGELLDDEGRLDTGDKTTEEFLSEQGIPEKYQPDVMQAIRKQQSINRLQQRQQEIRNVGNQAQDQVLQTFGTAGGSAQNPGSTESAESEGGQESGAEEASGAPGSSKDNPITVNNVSEFRQVESGKWVRNPNTGEVRPKK